MAPKSEPFVDIVTGAPAWFDTRVALLWDDECLYFGFSAEEPAIGAARVRRNSYIRGGAASFHEWRRPQAGHFPLALERADC